jgi:hypothetical protein
MKLCGTGFFSSIDNSLESQELYAELFPGGSIFKIIIIIIDQNVEV